MLRPVWLAMGLAACGALAHAGTVSYTCNPNIDSTVAGTCTYLNTTIGGLYNSTFTNATADIYIQYSAVGSGSGLASTGQFNNLVSYSTYLTQLKAESTDATALASLPSTEPSIFLGGDINITAALASALNISGATGVIEGSPIPADDGNACAIGTANCYNAVITLNDPTDLENQFGQGYYYRSLGGTTTNNYDIFSVIEHETDEVLGTASCITTSTNPISDDCGGTNASAADLFRYTSPGVRTFDTVGATAYFSPDGGVTDTAGNQYNNQDNGEDWADFSNSCTFIQDAEGCPGQGGLDITNDTGAPEIAILNAVGYDLVTNQTPTPEPGTMGLVALALVAMCGSRARRRA